MYEIYEQHAQQYDALVAREDYQSNLRSVLREKYMTAGVTVAEAGVGTGRLTRMYIDRARQVHAFDRSAHMLEQAHHNLAPWSGKLRLVPAEHRSLPLPDGTADVFIEGWAFGHVAVDHPSDVRLVTAQLVLEAVRVTRSGGVVILVETLGTNVESPAPPHAALEEFYDTLEISHGFEREVLRTDYRFETPDEAEILSRFFFGDEMGDSVASRLASARRGEPAIVPEFTGLWVAQT